tara:strand:- start:24799 stop:26115 length:1317 start_codon:yes stop_codon:yes gene_type:complete
MAVEAALIGRNRRGKTALLLFACGCAGVAPHLLQSYLRLFPAISLALFLGGYALRTIFVGIQSPSLEIPSKLHFDFNEKDFPVVDVLVAARNEEAVIKRLVETIDSLNYPNDKIKLWIIDDGSSDNTPIILDQLTSDHPNLSTIRREPDSGGGKSGALNYALENVKGKWLLILDADAQLQRDSLKRLLIYAIKNNFAAVQLRKAVVNPNDNLLTRFQAMEMAMDAVIQEGRLASDGVGELRGNGELLNRQALEKCGKFNEETVTDDLDLSFRLLMQGNSVGILWDPPVQEEAVETINALWKQRQRWAEGGLQRFFDYWNTLTSQQLSFIKKRDIACFFLLQYALPLVSFFDLLASVFTKSLPAFWPLSIAAFSISGFAYWRGCSRNSEGPLLPSPKPITLLLAIIYLSHWFIVIPWVAIRMSVLPKKLVWAKTEHRGI